MKDLNPKGFCCCETKCIFTLDSNNIGLKYRLKKCLEMKLQPVDYRRLKGGLTLPDLSLHCACVLFQPKM